MNPFGRPREFDRIKVAHDLLEWAKKDDSINLNKFCAQHRIVPSTMIRWTHEDDDFRESYEEAKSYIGYRREEMLNKHKLHVKAYDLNASTYDYFLKTEKRQDAEFEAKLKKESEQDQKGSFIVETILYAKSECNQQE